MIPENKNRSSILTSLRNKWPEISGVFQSEKFILIALGFILLLRILFIGLMGLMPQDAYYHFYGQHPALSYYDHPPAIGYLLRLFTWIFGEKVFAIKLACTVTTFFTVFAFYHLAKHFLSVHKTQMAVLLFFSGFLVTILSLSSTPDTPLLFFWALSLIALYKAIFLEKKIYWIWAGIAMGLSFDSKYTGILLLPGLFLFLIFSVKYRKLLFSGWLWLSIIFFALTISPVIIWNFQHDFASLSFQSSERLHSMSAFKIEIKNIFGVLAHQTGILLPVLISSLLIVLYKTIRKYGIKITRLPADKLFLLAFFLPTFLGFLAISPIYWVKINWMLPAYISGIIWVSTYFKMKWLRWQVVISVILHIAVAVEIIFYAVPVNSEDTWVGWDKLATEVKEIRKSDPGAFIFSSGSYKTPAVLDFYLEGRVYGSNVVGGDALQFSIVDTDLNKLKGMNAYCINPIRGSSEDILMNSPPDFIPPFFAEVKAMQPILIKKSGKVIRRFSVYRCINYKGTDK